MSSTQMDLGDKRPSSFSAARRLGRPQPRPVKDTRRNALKALKVFFQDNVFLFCQSPEELAKDRLEERNEEWKMCQLNGTLPRTDLPSNEYVQVEFYSQLNMLYQQMEPDIDTMFRLDEYGGLDLRALRRNWGLQTCVPIHPSRWDSEDPADRDWLSPLALANLCERGRRIKFTEPLVSKSTMRQRQLRASYRAFRSFSDLFLCYFISRLDQYTPLVKWNCACQKISTKKLEDIETTLLGFFVVLTIGSILYYHQVDLCALVVWFKDLVLCIFHVQ
ncbi:hypothetical protein IW261DRAFT_1453977 [Armillaria novae-zelandiae]|uniref:Uncharacterized protein n=1 Tax=Armillaria novae-zelandiae TaxID=153914 RepID=A0AA39UGC9_9AGAR|nr:hypothetical protein IW261DRAFT_1453977 [Armillaria novae-zelandiae]